MVSRAYGQMGSVSDRRYLTPLFLQITKSGAITAINIRIVYSDKDVDELAAEMRHAGTATDDNGFYIADEQARLTLKRRLGPEKQSGAVPARG